MSDWPSDVVSEETWGVVCDGCGLLPVVKATREDAREFARDHQALYWAPRPRVAAVRVRVVLSTPDRGRS